MRLRKYERASFEAVNRNEHVPASPAMIKFMRDNSMATPEQFKKVFPAAPRGAYEYASQFAEG